MATLVDTNSLLRSLNPNHPHHAAASDAIAALRLRDESLWVGTRPKSIASGVSFLCCLTRPMCSRNGNELSQGMASPASKPTMRISPH
jgi:hypothetical protein